MLALVQVSKVYGYHFKWVGRVDWHHRCSSFFVEFLFLQAFTYISNKVFDALLHLWPIKPFPNKTECPPNPQVDHVLVQLQDGGGHSRSGPKLSATFAPLCILYVFYMSFYSFRDTPMSQQPHLQPPRPDRHWFSGKNGYYKHLFTDTQHPTEDSETTEHPVLSDPAGAGDGAGRGSRNADAGQAC